MHLTDDADGEQGGPADELEMGVAPSPVCVESATPSPAVATPKAKGAARLFRSNVSMVGSSSAQWW